MIKIENVVAPSTEQWETIIRGCRNPMNSWNKSDSYYPEEYRYGDLPSDAVDIGDSDLNLMKRLCSAGTDHRKFMRMITVYVDITAPTFWWAEFDAYKIGTVRNSCSFMHKGVSRPFTIDDFSIKNKRIYDILRPLEKKKYELTYPYETDEFKLFTDENGRTYRVYRNGRVIQESYSYTDNYGSGRTRIIQERPITTYQNRDGYFIVKLAGRTGKRIPLHVLVAKMWCPGETKEAWQVDHLNTDKGDNSAENLEWVTPSENMQRALKAGLYDNLKSIHRRYLIWKNCTCTLPTEKRMMFKIDVEKGLTHKELGEKYGITPTQANNIRCVMKNSDVEDDFQEALVWDRVIEQLNEMRNLYLETKDNAVFQGIRCLLPSGYMQRSTVMLNYEVLANIYKSRKGHRLDEWKTMLDWIETLPYSELITGESKDKNETEDEDEED